MAELEGHLYAKLAQAHAIKENYTTIFAGLEFIVYPNVFNPEIFSSSHIIADVWLRLVSTFKPNSLLEIGTGAGYLSILAALNGANRVTATDISSEAVANIKTNIEKYNLNDRIQILHGSIFEPLNENDRFDVIFWNIPLSHIKRPSEELDSHERTVFDPGHGLAEIYLRDAHKYLTENGRLFMVFSVRLGNFERINQLASKNHWRLERMDNSEYVPIGSYDIYDGIDIDLYELIRLKD